MLLTTQIPLDTRIRLLNATLQHVEFNGFQVATTTAIAQWARLGTGILFRHFPTKEALLRAAFAFALTLLSQQTPPDSPPTTLYALVQHQWRQTVQRAVDHPAAFHYWRCWRATPVEPMGYPARERPSASLAPCSLRCGRRAGAPSLASWMPS